ncbi:MAG TPA: Tat pathway signal sequence domain protein, partial [Opitutaceae bacterium]|nr:Tat pathway signal sequence domain protein [Opitutaceae bacterium]
MNIPRLVCRVALALPFAPTAGLAAAAAPAAVTLDWLGHEAPTVDGGVSWGVPWPRGQLRKGDNLVLTSASGQSVPLQTWPMAYWPDGSVKWTGQAIATAAALDGPLHLAVGPGTEVAAPLTVTRSATTVEVDTGAVRAVLPLAGTSLIAALYVGGREVARDARLIARREDRSRYEAEQILREEDFASQIEDVKVEQDGPVRAVVKITGRHKSAT